jgi:hypothetical protein
MNNQLRQGILNQPSINKIKLEHFIRQIVEIDKNSTAFRYPRDKDENVIAPNTANLPTRLKSN